MNKKFHQYVKYFVIKFSAKVAAVLSPFSHVRYNIYFHADFVEGEMICRLNTDFVIIIIISIIIMLLKYNTIKHCCADKAT